MKKFASLVALAVLPVLGVLFSTPVFADSPGQLSNGASNYKVRNVTKNGAYAQTVAATCNETVKYSITLSNSDFGLLRNLTVKADMASGNITASATNANDQTTSVSGNAKVTLDKGTLSYVPGSTVRITSDGATSTTLADGITAGGVNAGNLNGSTAVFVQFQAKVNCPEEPKNIQVCELATKKIITIREDQFDASKHSKNLDDCKEVVKKIEVCELATKKIITINEKDFDASKHSKNLNDCKEEVKNIKVCELSTKKIITIDEKSFDATKHSKTLSDCAEKPPVPGEIVVCETATKKIVTIKENEFDASKHSKTLADCNVTPVVETPTELPQTGATGVFAVVAALLTAAGGYYVNSRKNVLG